jgi:hypothetical protein
VKKQRRLVASVGLTRSDRNPKLFTSNKYVYLTIMKKKKKGKIVQPAASLLK